MRSTKVFVLSGSAALLAVACNVTATNNPADAGSGGSNDSGSSSGGDSGGASDAPSDAGFCFTGTSPAPGETLVALACSQTSPMGVAIHNGVVYWTDYQAGGTVMSVPAAGGAPTTLATNQDWPYAIAVDDSNVYWTNYDDQYAPGGGSGTSGTVMKVPLTGGTPVALATGLSGPTAIAIDASNVYFANSVGGTLKSVPIAGGSVTTLATLQTPYGIAVESGVVYWTNYTGTTGPNGNSYASVMSVAATGGTPKTLTTSTDAVGAYGIAVNAATIFFTAQNNTGTATQVESIPLAGSTSPTILASAQQQATAIAVDGTNVYWTDNDPNTGSVSSIPQTGGTPLVLATKSDTALGIAVDPSGLYYTASGGGRVWRLTPP